MPINYIDITTQYFKVYPSRDFLSIFDKLTFNFKINFKNILFSAFFYFFFPVKIIPKTIFHVIIDTPTLVFF